MEPYQRVIAAHSRKYSRFSWSELLSSKTCSGAAKSRGVQNTLDARPILQRV